MRRLPTTALLLLLAACGAPPPPPAATDPVLEKLRAGEAPAELRYDKNPLWTAEIGKALAEDRAWKTDADAFAALVHFASHAGTDGLAVVEKLLGDPKPEQRMRGLLIARLSPAEKMPDLLKRYAPRLLDPSTPEVARVALGAIAYRGARGATEAVFEYFEKTEDLAALKALGILWAAPPSGGSTEATGGAMPYRTLVQLLAHKLTMGPAPSPESAGALLRVMTDVEIDAFLSKWVPETFGSREILIAAAGEKGFDAGRGRKIHEAFLKSPDPALVSTILWGSPHKLDAKTVNPLLDDDRVTSSGTKVRDYAAARLESMESGLPPELSADEVQRERLLKKWRSRR